MKKLLSAVLLIFICISLISCKQNASTTDPKYTFNEGNNEGNKKTEEVSLREITSSGVISYDCFFLNGQYYTDTDGDLYVPFNYNKKFGYSNQYGNPVIENINSRYSFCIYNFGEENAIANSEVIDRTGMVKYSLPDKWTSFSNGAGFIEQSGFEGGYALFFRNKSISDDEYNRVELYIGLLDSRMNYSEHKIQLPEGSSIDQRKWKLINQSNFRGAIGEYQNKDNISIIVVVNLDGKIVASYDSNKAHQSRAYSFSYINKSANADNSGYNLKDMIFISEGFVNAMDENGKWGLMNLSTGKMAIDYKYDFVGLYSEKKIPVCQYGSWGVVDIEGNVVFPCDKYRYKFISGYVNGRAIAVSEDEKLCIINAEGEMVSNIDIDIDKSSRGGIRFIPFIEKTHIACIYSYDHAYVIYDNGKVLLSKQITDQVQNSDQNSFLYMNNNYLVLCEKSNVHVYEIINRFSS